MKLLVCGLSPLPFENLKKNLGPGARSWHFAKALVDAGHDVSVFTKRIPFTYPRNTPPVTDYEHQDVRVVSADWEASEDLTLLTQTYEEVSPDALVGATIYGSYDACRLNPDVPIWADQFGLVMAEAQAKAYVAEDNGYIKYFWNMVEKVMSRADIFSSVSSYQRFAMIGELGALGRLIRETVGYEFVHTIPCGLDPTPLEHYSQVLRGVVVPPEAFVVLWSGGYNVWVDVDTLFEGIDGAMAQVPDLYFASTGGQIDGHDEVTYPKFKSLVKRSEFKDRYVLLGWRPKEEVTDYYFEADIGINTDRLMYEGLFGSKNRILDWMRAGLPALAAEHPELTRLLREEGIGFTFPLGDAQALSRKLVTLAGDRRRVQEVGRRAKAYGEEVLTFGATAAPLLAWASDPNHAPDHGHAPAFNAKPVFRAAHDAVPVKATRTWYERVRPWARRFGLLQLRDYLKGMSAR